MADSSRTNTAISLKSFRIALPHGRPILHTHDFHEIVQCHTGQGIQMIGDNEFDIYAGNVFFLPAGIEHIAISKPKSKCTLDVLYIQSSFNQTNPENITHSCSDILLQNLQKKTDSYQYKLPLADSSTQKLTSIFQMLIDEAAVNLPGQDIAETSIFELMALTFLRDPIFLPQFKDLFNTNTGGRIEHVEMYIQANYAHSLSISHLAKIAHLSRSHFHAAFRDATGMTPIQYIQAVRIKRAVELIKKGNLTIMETAMRCGFENLSHFYHVFKNHTGQSPAKFAKSCKN